MIQGNHSIFSIQDELYTQLEQWATSSRFERSERITSAPEEMFLPHDLFMPSFISLGPIHHESTLSLAMEAVKMRYLKSFLIRCRASLEELIASVRRIEEKLRSQYDEVFLRHCSSDGFVMMMLIDGIFLTEFLLRLHFKEWDEIDHMSQKRWTILTRDILLFENQLPFLLLEVLFTTARFRADYSDLSTEYLIRNFVAESGLWSDNKQAMKQMMRNIPTKNLHILGVRAMCMEFPKKKASDQVSLKSPSSPTIWQLHRAGVKFKQSEGVYCQILFQKGILEIPRLAIDENTEKLFVNLLAYEISNGKVHNVNDYVAMMDFLIDGPKDIAVLVQHGIIKNSLGDDATAANLINNLGRNIALSGDFSYSGLVEDLSVYCRSRSAKLRAELFDSMSDLKQNYVSSLWKFLSVIAAVILLILTVIQTVCSVLQVK